MELQQIQPDLRQHCADLFRRSIHKQADCADERRQCSHDFSSTLRLDEPWTVFVEHETDGIAAVLYGGKGILDAGDTAYFDTRTQE